jgi:D-methionine transport system ATP-binding protein
MADTAYQKHQTQPTPPVVTLQGVSRRFGDRPALQDITASIVKGEIIGLIGRSGAGKSTLIRVLNGLDKPQAGRVLIAGQDITDLDEAALQPIRRRIGMIFQHFNLLAQRTVAENVALPLKIAGQPAATRRKCVLELLDLVGLADKADQYPAQLSGGQKQRVGIARALAPDPLLLLSDEATSALDPETTESILDLLARVNQDLGLTILMITHEMEVVRRIAGRVLVLDAGRIVEEGPVARVLASPQSATTRSLVSGLSPSLPAGLAAALATQGDQALIRIDLTGAAARLPILQRISVLTGQNARLIHGGVNDVQGEPYARLFIALGTADATSVARVRADLSPVASAVEVLGYVHDNV